jgi:hypothetical protein
MYSLVYKGIILYLKNMAASMIFLAMEGTALTNGWKTFAERIRLGPRDVVFIVFDMLDNMVHSNMREVA